MNTMNSTDANLLPDMLLRYLLDRLRCTSRNITLDVINATGSPLLNTTTPPNDNQEQDAFIYIIAVLGFYSFGVIIMMIKFLQRERIDLEEEQMLEEFLKAMKKSRTLPKLQRRGSRYLPARLAHARASLPCISFQGVLSKSRKTTGTNSRAAEIS